MNDLNLIPKHIFLFDIPYSLGGCTIWQDRIGGHYVVNIRHRVNSIFGPVSDTKFRGNISLKDKFGLRKNAYNNDLQTYTYKRKNTISVKE